MSGEGEGGGGGGGGGGAGGASGGAAGGHGGGQGGTHAGAEPVVTNAGNHGTAHATNGDAPLPIKVEKVTSSTTQDNYPISPRAATPNPFSRKNTSIDLEDYFEGPRDIAKHSKWPLFLQMHGSILPKMIIPLLFVAAWSTAITLLKHFEIADLGVQSILLTVTGFVVGLGLSFRSSTAYERYAEGRRFWGQLTLTCQSLGRIFWTHVKERDEFQKKDVLGKLTAMNLLVTFSVALKHKLRFEPYTYYDDISSLVEHLDTLAKDATDGEIYKQKQPNIFKTVGDRLGVPFAASNPRKVVKKVSSPVGNLPLEIICYLSAYADEIVGNGQLPIPMTQTGLYNGIQALNDVMVNTERVLNTPLPIAYTIAISQITWIYIAMLPFQLVGQLNFVTIPASIVAAYIIMGILFIGREIENPFGTDVNDLPLDLFCKQVMDDMEIMASRPPAKFSDFVESSRNKVLFPYSESSYHLWAQRPDSALRSALRNRPYANFERTTKTAAGEKRETGDANV